MTNTLIKQQVDVQEGLSKAVVRKEGLKMIAVGVTLVVVTFVALVTGLYGWLVTDPELSRIVRLANSIWFLIIAVSGPFFLIKGSYQLVSGKGQTLKEIWQKFFRNVK